MAHPARARASATSPPLALAGRRGTGMARRYPVAGRCVKHECRSRAGVPSDGPAPGFEERSHAASFGGEADQVQMLQVGGDLLQAALAKDREQAAGSARADGGVACPPQPDSRGRQLGAPAVDRGRGHHHVQPGEKEGAEPEGVGVARQPDSAWPRHYGTSSAKPDALSELPMATGALRQGLRGSRAIARRCR
jgi:hypothetical protein